jgi:hypothetical protein
MCLSEIDAIMADIEAAEGDMCSCYVDLKPELTRLQVPHHASTLRYGPLETMRVTVTMST